MRYGINVPNAFEYADPRVLARMAAEAERAGWVAGFWPNRAPFRRAARWDGAVPEKEDGISPDDISRIRTLLEEVRPAEAGTMEIVVGFESEGPPAQRVATVRGFAEAGATWWSERITPRRGSLDGVLALIADGPPRI
jgi:hypothetical protein